jgi:hypothetical protein
VFDVQITSSKPKKVTENTFTPHGVGVIVRRMRRVKSLPWNINALLAALSGPTLQGVGIFELLPCNSMPKGMIQMKVERKFSCLEFSPE